MAATFYADKLSSTAASLGSQPTSSKQRNVAGEAERAHSAFFFDAGALSGEHVCVVSATTPQPKHVQQPEHLQARCYSEGNFDPLGGAAAAMRRSRLEHADSSPPSSARRKLLACTSIHEFSQLVEVYRGSLSTVYQAVENTTGTRVVVKAYHKMRMSEKHNHKLRREVEISQLMSGDYVAQTLGAFEDSEAVYIIMELCEGGDLFKSMLLHGGHLEEHYVCVQVIAPLLRVIEKMHALQLMHRDIKPENIFLTRGGQLRLGDFGLALKCAEELPFSRSGTLDYMAPEVLRNNATQLQEGPEVTMQQLAYKGIRPYTTQVDVWAVGILAYELVFGKPPFEVEDETHTITLIMYSNDVQFPPQHSLAWADFVRHALVKDPTKRPNASQLLHHPWILHHLHRARTSSCVSPRDIQRLLTPLPLGPDPRAPQRPAPAPPAAVPSDRRPARRAPPPLDWLAAEEAERFGTQSPGARAAHAAGPRTASTVTALGAVCADSTSASRCDSGSSAGSMGSPAAVDTPPTTAAAVARAGLRASPRSTATAARPTRPAQRVPVAAPPAPEPAPTCTVVSDVTPSEARKSKSPRGVDDLQQYVTKYMAQFRRQLAPLSKSPRGLSKSPRGQSPRPAHVRRPVLEAFCASPPASAASSPAADSPHPPAGWNERLKDYLRHQKFGRNI